MALQHLRSSTADKRPTPAAMSDGQLALNTNLVSPGLFFKDSNGDSVKIGPVHVGTTAPNVTPGAGGQAGNSKGEQWLDTSSSRYVFKIWDGTAWRTEDGEFVNVSGDTMTGALVVPLASAATPSLTFTGDLNTGIFSPGADQVAVATNGTQRLTVDTAATTSTLPVVHPLGAVGTPSITFTGDLNTGIYSPAADTIAFAEGGSEVARLDSSGRLLVGTSSSVSTFGVAPRLQIAGGEAYQSNIAYRADAFAPFISVGHSRSATIGTQTILQSGDDFGSFAFVGSDGTGFIQGARITAAVDGTPGTNDMPGRLVFSTTDDGAASPTEALRITNDRVIAYNQPTPTSKSAAATLTITELKTGIIQYTGAVATLTLPTGTLMEGGFSNIYTNMAFEWSVINTGAGICTVAAGTDHTVIGSGTVAIGASARFVSRRTAANTFVSYRLS